MAKRKQSDQTTVPNLGRSDRPPSSRSGGLVLITLSGDQVGTIHLLDKERMLLGREDVAEIHVLDEGVSRRHAALRWNRAEGRYALVDLRSSNGTFLNDVRIEEPKLIERGDRIRIGKSSIFRVSFANELEVRFAQTMNAAALRDPLTETFNRRYIEHRLASEVAFARRHGTNLSVLMLDLDHFKLVNDTHGHTVGDAVLRETARVVQTALRTEDVLARFGGEEFLVICRDIDLSGAMVVGARIRHAIDEHAFPLEGATLHATVSIGIAAHSEGALTMEELLRTADAALYAAKAGGRNRVVRFDEL